MSSLQDERSAETRRRLMDATVDCLYERGYVGTTTTEIATRAGVSRGAQLHHFPHKDELVISALNYVFNRRIEELHALTAERPPGDREARLIAFIDLLWPICKGPTFYAWLELVVASRTDPALKSAVRAASDRLTEGVLTGIANLLDCPSNRAVELEQLVWLIFGQLEALAMERILYTEDDDPPVFTNAIRMLKSIAVVMLRAMEL